MKIRLANGTDLIFHDVAYAPNAQANVISVQQTLARLYRQGDKEALHEERHRSSRLLSGTGTTLFTGSLRKKLYYMDVSHDQDFQ